MTHNPYPERPQQAPPQPHIPSSPRPDMHGVRAQSADLHSPDAPTSDMHSVPKQRPERRRSAVRTVWQHVLSALIGAIGVIVSMMGMVALPLTFDAAGELTGLGAFVVLLLLVLWSTVFLRLRHPLVPFIAGCLLAAGWGDALLLLVGIFHVVVRGRTRQAVTVSLVGSVLVVQGVLRHALGDQARNPFTLFFLEEAEPLTAVPTAPEAVLASSLLAAIAGVVGLGVAIGVGLLVRRTKRMEAVETYAQRETARNESLETQLARQSERELLARELHDSLSHRLSVISLHSGALEVGGGDDSRVSETAVALRREAQASLADLRDLVGGVREGTLGQGGAAAEQTTPPSIASMRSLPQLVASVRSTGTAVRPMIILQDVETAPTVLDRAVYRIVQESLTNAMKHAPGAPITLEVEVAAATGARIRVENPVGEDRHREAEQGLLPQQLGSSGSGAGLEGIRERVLMLDGHAHLGVQGESFVVEVSLPAFAGG